MWRVMEEGQTVTVPHISASTWTAGRIGVLAPHRRVPVGAPRPADAAATRGFPWLDVAVQAVAGGAIVALLWAVIAGGLVQNAVDAFTSFYVGTVAPTFAMGDQPVIQDVSAPGGYFADMIDAPVPVTVGSVALPAQD